MCESPDTKLMLGPAMQWEKILQHVRSAPSRRKMQLSDSMVDKQEA